VKDARFEGLHHVALIAFAGFLGLFEGPTEIACIAALVTTALTGRLKGLSAHPVYLGALLWGLAGIPGVITAETAYSSQGYLRPVHALALLIGARGLRDVSAKTLTKMGWAFCLAIVFNGAYGLLQATWGALPLDSLLMSNKNSPQVFVPGSRETRCASGLFYNRLRLAHVGAIGLSVLSVLSLGALTQRIRRLAAAGLLLLALAVVLTYARMVLAAWTGAAVLLVLLLSTPRRAGLMLAGGLSVASAVLAAESGRQRILRAFEDLSIRAEIFSMALRLFVKQPFFGVGHGDYPQNAMPLLRPGGSRNWTIDAHNLYLHTLAETGIVGAIGFFVAVGGGLWGLLRQVQAQASSTHPQAILRRCALLVLITFAGLGLVHYPLHHAAVGLTFWAAVGLGTAVLPPSGMES